MSVFKKKLNSNLEIAIKNKYYKNYRVLIHCKTLRENIEKKIISYKGVLIHSIPSLNCICASISLNSIERLIEYPEVNYITFDSYASLCGSSTLAANGVGFKINRKFTGKGIGVGIVDTGTYPHADLVKQNNRIRGFLDLTNNYRYPYDDNGHGTFISGIISGSGSLSKGMYKGVAENSHLYSIKAFNSLGRGFISDILFGIQTLINEAVEYNIKVICLPFEILDMDYFILSLFSKLFSLAVTEGITIVVPSGNCGNTEGSIKGIATLENCITVAGLDSSSGYKPYEYSSAGFISKLEKPDLSAACVDICSLNSNTMYISERNGYKLYAPPMDRPYTSYTGTSCAAAYIAGICALLYEKNTELCFKDTISLLKASCKMLEVHKSLQGAGIVDISKLIV